MPRIDAEQGGSPDRAAPVTGRGNRVAHGDPPKRASHPVLDVLAVAGHRYDNRHPVADEVQARLGRWLRSAYEVNHTRKVVSGMGIGVDIWGGEAAIALRNHGLCPQLRFVAAVPFLTQFALWSADWQDRWGRLLREADEIHLQDHEHPGVFRPVRYLDLMKAIVETQDHWMEDQAHRKIPPDRRSEYPPVPQARSLLLHRNRWVVDQAKGLLAIYEERASGTGNTVDYAKGRIYVRGFNPLTRKTWLWAPD